MFILSGRVQNYLEEANASPVPAAEAVDDEEESAI